MVERKENACLQHFWISELLFLKACLLQVVEKWDCLLYGKQDEIILPFRWLHFIDWLYDVWQCFQQYLSYTMVAIAPIHAFLELF